jgi:hypothetical protein
MGTGSYDVSSQTWSGGGGEITIQSSTSGTSGTSGGKARIVIGSANKQYGGDGTGYVVVDDTTGKVLTTSERGVDNLFTALAAAGIRSDAKTIADIAGKINALSREALAELDAKWLEDYMEWIKEIDLEDRKYTRKMNLISNKINEVKDKYELSTYKDAMVVLMEVDSIIAKQPDASSSLIRRLEILSIDDPLFIEANITVIKNGR